MKKKLFILILASLFVQISFAQGIAFEPSIEIAIQKAKATNKLLFVECYHPNCPICMALEPTLKNPEVGKFYNKNFINYKLNLSDAKQVAFLNKKNIYLPSFPMFFFFDKNQEIVHHTDPVNAPQELIQHAKDAMNPEAQSGLAWKKYQAGNRDVSTLTGLSYLLRIKQDTIKNILVANELFKVYPKNQLNSKASWNIAKKCLMDVENGFAEYWLNHIDVAKNYEAELGHAGNEKNALGFLVQKAIYEKNASNYSLTKVNKLKHYMQLVGAGQYISGATWQIECPALLREQGQDKAFAFLKNIADGQTQAQALVYYVTFFNNTFKEAKYTAQARAWLERALPNTRTNQELANYYFESARLFQKSGDSINAKKHLLEAQNQVKLAKNKVTDVNLKTVIASIEKNINKLAGELK